MISVLSKLPSVAMAARFLLLSLMAGCLGAQRTWIVDWAQRPGTDFIAIQPAVDAAAEGDTILVRATDVLGAPANHSYPAPVIDGKGLRLMGDGANTEIRGPLVVRNLSATQSVSLLAFTRGRYGQDNRNYFDIQNCAGTVLLDSLNIVAPTRITNSRLTVASHCQIKQMAGFYVTDSTLMLDASTTDYQILFLTGWPPLTAIRSRVWLSFSTLRAQSCWNGEADVGVELENSDLWVGPGTTIIAGTRCFGGGTAILDGWRSPTSQCINFTVPPSRIRIDPTAQIFGAGPGCPNITFGPQTAIWTSRTNDTLTVEQRGTPLSITVLALGPFDPSPVPGLLAPLAVNLGQSILCLSSLPSTGALQWPFAIPPGLPPGFHIGIQAGAISPSGELSLSNAGVFSIW